MHPGQKRWLEFQREHGVEETVYLLAKEALEIMRGKLGCSVINAFALCPMGYEGGLCIAYNVDDGTHSGMELQEEEYLPPDWSDEADEDLVQLFRQGFEDTIGREIRRVQDEDEYHLLGDFFAEGYLDSVRRVLVRLEREKAFSRLHTALDCWFMVTEIDADLQAEERRLEELRNGSSW